MNDSLTVRRAKPNELTAILQLIHDAYLRSGLILPQVNRTFSLYPHLDNIEETVPLIAMRNGIKKQRMLGTVTVTFDGPNGLSTDVNYPKQTQEFRKQGLKLASCWRLATRWDCRSTRTVLFMLVKSASQLVRNCDESMVLMECHPRHASYYQRRLGFEPVGERKTTHGLTDAPSVLMVGGPGSYSRLLT